MAGIEDLLCPEDAYELKWKFRDICKEDENYLRSITFGKFTSKDVFDWEVDLESDFFDE